MTRYRLKNDLGSCVAGTILWDVDIEPLPDEPKDKPPCPKCGDEGTVDTYFEDNPYAKAVTKCDCQKGKPMKTANFLDGPQLTMARLEKENADLRAQIEAMKQTESMTMADLRAENIDLHKELESETKWAKEYHDKYVQAENTIRNQSAEIESRRLNKDIGGGGYVVKIEKENADLRAENKRWCDQSMEWVYRHHQLEAEVERLTGQVKNLQHSWGGTLPKKEQQDLERKLALANEEIKNAYNDNEIHRGRINDLEQENTHFGVWVDNCKRKLALLMDVYRAFIIEGKCPEHHRARVRQLQREWPSLFNALNAARDGGIEI
jgi:hypothetical protein